MADELNPDITPYDLAQRVVDKRHVTDTGKCEVAAELLAVFEEVKGMQSKINDGDCNTDDLIEFVGKLVKRTGYEPGDI